MSTDQVNRASASNNAHRVTRARSLTNAEAANLTVEEIAETLTELRQPFDRWVPTIIAPLVKDRLVAVDKLDVAMAAARAAGECPTCATQDHGPSHGPCRNHGSIHCTADGCF